MQAALPGAVEEGKGELRRPAGVLFVEAAGAAELEHAALARRQLAEQVRLPVALQIVDEQAIAQAAVGDAQLRQPKLLHEHVEDRRAADDDVGAGRRQIRGPVAALLATASTACGLPPEGPDT